MPLHLISWNVASWATSLKEIRAHHRGGAAAWMRSHALDVLCLQEVKTADSKLEAHAADHAAHVPGFDSFWACNRTKARSGFDGVATYARAGLVLAADRRPLRDAELDDEGRCIRTDLRLVPTATAATTTATSAAAAAAAAEEGGGRQAQTLALFNVYVPNGSSSGARQAFKLRFLRALRCAMDGARAQGCVVALVGDTSLLATY